MIEALLKQYKLPQSCQIVVPKDGTALHHLISRWSDIGVSRPAAIITPSTVEDIVAVVKFASKHRFRVLPENGAHSTFVRIDDKTIYLDMNKLGTVSIDEANSCVSVGGGTITGDMLKACASKGYYTMWPNSNAVGVIGAFLGGGSGAFNGLHGFAVDHVLSVQLVTASGDVLTLNATSTGDESSLYRALRGAGHGFGVITSLTMRAFRIADLKLTNDKYWQGNYVFPSTSIDDAVDAFVKLLPPPRPLLPVLIFSRAPPTHPAKGAPLVVLAVSYFGPHADAEQAAAPIMTPEVTKKATLSKISLEKLIDMNNAAEVLNGHGGYKDFYNCMCHSVSGESIKKAFDRWIRFGDEAADAKDRSTLVIGVWNTDALQANAAARGGDKTFYRPRDRGCFIQATGSYSDRATQAAADRFGSDLVTIMRETDTKQGLEPAVFANNMRFGQDMKEVYSTEMLQELKRLKDTWDPSGVFFTPACSW